jgi:hypothetical protein
MVSTLSIARAHLLGNRAATQMTIAAQAKLVAANIIVPMMAHPIGSLRTPFAK